MARFEFGGIDNYITQLNKLQAATKDDVIGKTVYAGAAVVADAVKDAIRALPVGSGHAAQGELVDTVTLPQKEGLLDGFGMLGRIILLIILEGIFITLFIPPTPNQHPSIQGTPYPWMIIAPKKP